MEIEEKAIYDEMANYVGNGDAWDEALKDWVKVPDPSHYDYGKRINSDGSYLIGDMSLLDKDPSELKETQLRCDKEETKEWSDEEAAKAWRNFVEDNNLHMRPATGNISADNWAATNHKKVNLSLYVVNAVKGHMVESIDELN